MKIDFEKFEKVLQHYGGNYEGFEVNSEVVSEMLKNFSEEKEHIYKLFGNKLKISKEIDVTVSRNECLEIKKELRLSLSGPHYLFLRGFLRSVTSAEFLKNEISSERNYEGIKIPKGMKVSKALLKFCLPKYAHEVVTAHSMSNQKLFTRGRAVISIDPVDFITMSSNSSGWRSCHRLDGGEYRTGPLAYLLDSSSVICYIESKTPCKINFRGEEIEHSNKSWRQIALVNPNCKYVLQERQYPDKSAPNQNAISEMFVDLLSKHHNTNDVLYEEIDVNDTSNLHMDYAIEEDEVSLYYNDIINEMFYSSNIVCLGEVKIDQGNYSHNNPCPVKGERVPCLKCGDHLSESDSLLCYNCQ